MFYLGKDKTSYRHLSLLPTSLSEQLCDFRMLLHCTTILCCLMWQMGLQFLPQYTFPESAVEDSDKCLSKVKNALGNIWERTAPRRFLCMSLAVSKLERREATQLNRENWLHYPWTDGLEHSSICSLIALRTQLQWGSEYPFLFWG